MLRGRRYYPRRARGRRISPKIRAKFSLFLSHCRYVGACIRSAVDGADVLHWQCDEGDEAAYVD
jgi:hypothetical protein